MAPHTGLFLDDMADYLVAYSSGALNLTIGTNLFKIDMPDAPDAITALYEYSGEPPDQTMGPSPLPALELPRMQVVCRDVDYPTAMVLARGIYKALNVMGNQTVDATYYLRAEPLQMPFLFHRDDTEARRYYIACNYRVTRTPST